MERGKVAADVNGEPMHRDPFADTDTEGSDLAIPDPDTGFSRNACSVDAVTFEQGDENFL